jgi:hypothetical protein
LYKLPAVEPIMMDAHRIKYFKQRHHLKNLIKYTMKTYPVIKSIQRLWLGVEFFHGTK